MPLHIAGLLINFWLLGGIIARCSEPTSWSFGEYGQSKIFSRSRWNYQPPGHGWCYTIFADCQAYNAKVAYARFCSGIDTDRQRNRISRSSVWYKVLLFLGKRYGRFVLLNLSQHIVCIRQIPKFLRLAKEFKQTKQETCNWYWIWLIAKWEKLPFPLIDWESFGTM